MNDFRRGQDDGIMGLQSDPNGTLEYAIGYSDGYKLRPMFDTSRMHNPRSVSRGTRSGMGAMVWGTLCIVGVPLLALIVGVVCHA